MGHTERNCSNRLRDAKGGKTLEGQFGEWMRVSPGRMGSIRKPFSVIEKGAEGRD